METYRPVSSLPKMKWAHPKCPFYDYQGFLQECLNGAHLQNVIVSINCSITARNMLSSGFLSLGNLLCIPFTQTGCITIKTQ